MTSFLWHLVYNLVVRKYGRHGKEKSCFFQSGFLHLLDQGHIDGRWLWGRGGPWTEAEEAEEAVDRAHHWRLHSLQSQ